MKRWEISTEKNRKYKKEPNPGSPEQKAIYSQSLNYRSLTIEYYIPNPQ